MKELDCYDKYMRNAGNTRKEYCDEIILVGKERSKPMTDAIATTDFDKNHLHVVASFKDAVAIMQNMLDANYAVLFENDLPDNYAK